MSKRTCSIPDCGDPVHAHGWCNFHYRRWCKHGDPLGGGPRIPKRSFEQRFWAKVNKDGPPSEHRPDLGPCWLWKASLRHGYGAFGSGGHDGPVLQAHRVAYELLGGPIPEGLTLDHLCRVRRCVRPNHLEPVTSGENVLRGISGPAANARKTHCKHGHAYTPANTRHDKGHRCCLECDRVKARRLYRRHREQKLARQRQLRAERLQQQPGTPS